MLTLTLPNYAVLSSWWFAAIVKFGITKNALSIICLIQEHTAPVL